MSNQLQIFNNPKFGQVRIIEINGKSYFVGIDIAKALGYKDPNSAISRHCRGSVKRPVPTSSGTQEMNVIPEGDIYRLAAKSELPGAEEFESWIFDEVLPSIRKHGAYMTPDTIDKVLSDPDFGIRLLSELKKEREEKKALESKVKELTPAAEFGNAIGNCKDAILIRDFCKVLVNAGIKIGQDKLFSWLHAKGYIFRDKGTGDWRPYMKYVNEMELFKVKETTISTRER